MKKYWLGLSMIKGLGPLRINTLLECFGDPGSIWKAPKNKLHNIKGVGKAAQNIVKQRQEPDLEKILKRLEQKRISFITINEEKYPEILKTIHDPPPVIFYKGNFSFNRPAIAIVGSRRCTGYGKKVAKKIAYKLVQRGITVISGMARGIDTSSHLGALKGKGKTVAVLGSGLDHIYPPENKDLFKEIQHDGCVISEFPPGVEPLSKNFPRRNRIISGLSKGTVVVEASNRSGSLITSNLALEQGREVFAVPGNISRPQSQGTNDLIKKGAKIVTEVSDILEELFLYNDYPSSKEKATYPQLTDEEEKIIKVLQLEETMHINDIIKSVELNAGQVNTILLKLELKGLVSKEEGKKYSFETLQNLLKPI